MKKCRGRRITSVVMVIVMVAMLLGNHNMAINSFAEPVTAAVNGLTATASNADPVFSFRNTQTEDIAVLVQGASASYQPGDEIELDVYLKNNSTGIITDGVLEARGGAAEGMFTVVSDDLEDLESMFSSEWILDAEMMGTGTELIEGLELEPGDLCHLKFTGTVPEHSPMGKTQDITFRFSGYGEDGGKAVSEESFLYNVSQWNLGTVTVASDGNLAAGGYGWIHVDLPDGNAVPGDVPTATSSDVPECATATASNWSLESVRLESELDLQDVNFEMDETGVFCSFRVPDEIYMKTAFGKVILDGNGALSSTGGIRFSLEGGRSPVVMARDQGITVKARSIEGGFPQDAELIVEQEDVTGEAYGEVAALLAKQVPEATEFSMYQISVVDGSGNPVPDEGIAYEAFGDVRAAKPSGIARLALGEESGDGSYSLMHLDTDQAGPVLRDATVNNADGQLFGTFLGKSRTAVVLTEGVGLPVVGGISVAVGQDAKPVGTNQSFTFSANASQSVEGGRLYYRISIADLKGATLEGNFDASGNLAVDVIKGNDVTLHLEYGPDGEPAYMTFSLAAGETTVFSLSFSTRNGISGNSPEVTLKVYAGPTMESLGDTAIKDVEPWDSATAIWSGEFGWQGPSKSVTPTELTVDNAGTIVGDKLTYTMSATSLNGDKIGEVFTENLVFNDILTLPEGITFPEGCVWEDSSGTLRDKDGNTVFQVLLGPIKATYGTGNVSFEGVSFDRSSTVFRLAIRNSKLEKFSEAELGNPSFQAELSVPQLEAETGYRAEAEDKIHNQVTLDAAPYDPYKDGINPYHGTAAADVTLKDQAYWDDLRISKVPEPSTVTLKPGSEVSYSIGVYNQGNQAAVGKTITDEMPPGMYLRPEHLKALLGDGYGTEVSGNSTLYRAASGKIEVTAASVGALGEKWTIRWLNQTVLPGDTKNGLILKYTCAIWDNEERLEKLFPTGAQLLTRTNTAKVDKQTARATVNIFRQATVAKYCTIIQVDPNTPGKPVDGSDVEYRVTVSNSSGMTVKDYILTDIMDPGLVLKADNGVYFDNAGIYPDVMVGGRKAKVTVGPDHRTVIEWNLGNIAVGEKIVIRYRARFDEQSVNAGALDTKVTVRNRANDAAGNISYQKEPDFKYGKAIQSVNNKTPDNGNKSPVTPGDVITYELTVTNNTDKPASYTAADTLPYAQKDGAIIHCWSSKNVEADEQGGFMAGTMTAELEPGQKPVIRWSDIKVGPGKTVTQKITLTYPELESLNALFGGGQYIYNGLTVNSGREVKVSHYIDKEKVYEAYIRKGVYQLGSTKNSGNWFVHRNDQGNSLMYYAGGRDDVYVLYYCLIANTGEEPVDIIKAVDVLPDGVEYVGLPNLGYGSLDGASLVVNGRPQTTSLSTFAAWTYADKFLESWPYVPVDYTVSAKATGNEITFQFGNKLTLGTDKYAVIPYLCKMTDTAVDSSGYTNKVAVGFAQKNVKVKEGSVDNRNFGQNNGYGLEPNDGGCQKWADGSEYGDTENQYGWMVSDVTVYPILGIVPGITKTAVQTIDKIPVLKPDYQTDSDYTKLNPGSAGVGIEKMGSEHNVESAQVVRWDIEISNEAGVDDLVDYRIRDTIEDSYEIVDVWYALPGKAFQRLDQSAWSQCTVNSDGSRTYTFDFKDSKDLIPSGEKAVLAVYTAIPDGRTGILGSRINTARLYTRQEFNAERVEPGKGEVKSDGDNVDGYYATYLENSDTVNLMNGFSTSSRKEISQVTDLDNRAEGGKAGKNFITVEDSSELVQYTLRVTNTSEQGNDLRRFVLIDYLPEVGDHGTWDSGNDRGSEFSVKLAEDPGFSVKMAGRDITGDCTIGYSDTAEYTEDDWNGITKWDGQPGEDTRSFRICLPQDYELKGGEDIVVTFQGKISEGAQPGQTAWNSFGYRYYDGSGAHCLTAAPPMVGVRIRPVPSLEKKVVDFFGKEQAADGNKQFAFELYLYDLATGSLGGKIRDLNVVQGGFIQLKGLAPGQQYALKETDTGGMKLLRYEIDGTPVKPSQMDGDMLIFKYEGKNISITAVNRLGIKLPDTGGTGTEPLMLAGTLLLMFGAFALTQGRRKKWNGNC